QPIALAELEVAQHPAELPVDDKERHLGILGKAAASLGRHENRAAAGQRHHILDSVSGRAADPEVRSHTVEFSCLGLRPRSLFIGLSAMASCAPCSGRRRGAAAKAISIRRRVSASGVALDGPFPPKPPKMRWATYERLRAVDAALQEQWLFGAVGDLGRLHSR